MKNNISNKLRLFTWTILMLLIFPQIAYAYLDPGSGSYILQVLIGAIVGIAFTLKIYWKKIALLISNLISRNQKIEKDDI